MEQQNQYDAALPERLAAEENARKEERINETAQNKEEIKAISLRLSEGWKKFVKEEMAKGKSLAEISSSVYEKQSINDFIERPDKDKATRQKFVKENGQGAEPETDTEFYKAVSKNISEELYDSIVRGALWQAKQEFDAEKPVEEENKPPEPGGENQSADPVTREKGWELGELAKKEMEAKTFTLIRESGEGEKGRIIEIGGKKKFVPLEEEAGYLVADKEKNTPKEPAIAEKAKLESLKEKAYGEKAPETGTKDDSKRGFGEVSKLLEKKAQERGFMERNLERAKKQGRDTELWDYELKRTNKEWEALDKEYRELSGEASPEVPRQTEDPKARFEEVKKLIAEKARERGILENDLKAVTNETTKQSLQVDFLKADAEWKKLDEEYKELDNESGITTLNAVSEKPEQKKRGFRINNIAKWFRNR